MGQHPSTTIEFTFPKKYTKKEIHQAIKRAIDKHPLLEFETLEPEKYMTALYSSPTCGWLDLVHFSLRENSKAIIVTGYSRSTNICPSSFGCFRTVFNCIGGYSDRGSNCVHIFDIIDQLESDSRIPIKYSRKKLVARTGASKLRNINFDESEESDDQSDMQGI